MHKSKWSGGRNPRKSLDNKLNNSIGNHNNITKTKIINKNTMMRNKNLEKKRMKMNKKRMNLILKKKGCSCRGWLKSKLRKNRKLNRRLHKRNRPEKPSRPKKKDYYWRSYKKKEN